MDSIPIYRTDGKVIGFVKGDTFYKQVKGSIHQLQQPPAWASDLLILKQVQSLGVKRMVILDIEINFRWECCINAFWGSYSFEIDRGFGIQRALPLHQWVVKGDGIPQQLELFRSLAMDK